jgi:phosphatidylglycerophosphate synthase
VKPVPPISANQLTAARLPLAPLAVVLLLKVSVWGTIGAALVALCLELTDLLDGKIARSYGTVSSFGKLFDPFSDVVDEISGRNVPVGRRNPAECRRQKISPVVCLAQ